MHLFKSLLVWLASSSTQVRLKMPSQTNDDIDRRWISWSAGSEPSDTVTDFRVDVTVNGVDLNVPVDTGSTGFLLSATWFGYEDDTQLREGGYARGFQYLSSSRRYYEGYWVPSNLTFTATRTGTQIYSRIPVLAVTEAGRCPSFVDGKCTARTDVRIMPDSIKYMGVGFGRWSDEQPDGTVDKNAFLNIDFDGDGTLRDGYIISDQGVLVGVRTDELTEDNRFGWKLTKLARNTEAPTGPRPEWKGTPMCAQVASGTSASDGSEISTCSHGTALFDTGINYTFLGVPPAATVDLKVSYDNGSTYVLKPGVIVTINIGASDTNVIGSYSYTVGDESDPMAPDRVRLVREHSDGAFVNTGSKFFKGFEVLFDEASGTVGLRPKASGHTPMRPTNQETILVQGGEWTRETAALKL